MECEYAKMRRGAKIIDCGILKARGEKFCACGNQRYCPQKQGAILTAGAFRCPVKEKNEGNAGGQ